MSVNPYDASNTPGQPPDPTPARRGFRLLELPVVLGVIGLVIALLLPLRRSAGEAARRSTCTNNLKHIGIDLHKLIPAPPPTPRPADSPPDRPLPR